MEIEPQSLLLIERADLKIRGPIVTDILKDNLINTALVQERDFILGDVLLIRAAILLAAPYAHPKVHPSLWEHAVYSSILARHVSARAVSDELK